MKTGDLIISQLESLSKAASDLLAYARKSAPDGWDYQELETVDAMLNTINRQTVSVLASIGEPLKLERAAREA